METQAPSGGPAPPADELPPRPQPPRDEDCCRGGCLLCVFDLYQRDLERWQQQVDEILRRRAAAGQSPQP